MNIVFEKLTNVELPHKAHKEDAGIDFYIPNDLTYVLSRGKGVQVSLSDKVIDGEEVESLAIAIKPHESVLIPTGIKSKFDDGYALVFFNRSGIATKKHLFRGACVVDSQYRGEILVNLTNVSNDTQYLFPGDKMIQALVLPVPEVEILEGEVENNTKRGDGGFGSTDK